VKPYYSEIKPHPPRRSAAIPPLLSSRVGYASPAVTPLDAHELAALRTLPLRARMLVESGGLGFHQSHRRGSDVEFADYRDYQMGDDLKRIDWRLYARTDRLHVRRSHSETPMRLVLLLDTSRSMAYAGMKNRLSKLDYARAMLGALALLARRQRDACGAGLLGEDLGRWLPPSNTIARIEAVWALLDSPPAAMGTRLPEALDKVLAVAPRRCLFVLASDFYVNPEALAPALKRLRGEGHELIAMRVLDPVEIDFDFSRPGEFLDIETGEQLQTDPAVASHGYRAEFARHARLLEESIAAQGGDFLSLRTDTLPLDGLRAYLSKRAHRR
jgi:uncharacterized protein (DUF58 family)